MFPLITALGVGAPAIIVIGAAVMGGRGARCRVQTSAVDGPVQARPAEPVLPSFSGTWAFARVGGGMHRPGQQDRSPARFAAEFVLCVVTGQRHVAGAERYVGTRNNAPPMRKAAPPMRTDLKWMGADIKEL